MNIIIFILISSLLISTPIFSQYYEPQSPLVFKKKRIQKSTISQKISAERVFFQALDIEELKIQIGASNGVQ